MWKLHHKDSGADYEPREGEVRMKTFVSNEAKKYGVTESAIFRRIERGKYPNIKIREHNSWTKFVSTK